MASCSTGQTWRIARELRSGQMRLESIVTLSRRSGSIHRDVPVKPRCPKEREEKYWPDVDGSEGVSQPRERDVPSGDVSRRVNTSMVSACTIGEPPRNIHSAK